MANTVVAVVGAGGIGSIIVEIFARLGVKEIICVDDDVIEISNISRVLGTYIQDAESHIEKVKVLQRHVKAINPKIIYTPVVDTILDPQDSAMFFL